MSFIQMLILILIHSEPGIGRGAIHDQLLSLGISPENVDVQLRSLADRKLIQRTTKGGGRRRLTTQRLTKSGQEKIKKFLPSFRKMAEFVG